MAESSADRIVISVLGKNRTGIVARVSGICADENVDIRDISQSIVGGLFTMTVLATLPASGVHFADLQDRLVAAGKDLGLEVQVQRQDVFEYMYRL